MAKTRALDDFRNRQIAIAYEISVQLVGARRAAQGAAAVAGAAAHHDDVRIAAERQSPRLRRVALVLATIGVRRRNLDALDAWPRRSRLHRPRQSSRRRRAKCDSDNCRDRAAGFRREERRSRAARWRNDAAGDVGSSETTPLATLDPRRRVGRATPDNHEQSRAPLSESRSLSAQDAKIRRQQRASIPRRARAAQKSGVCKRGDDYDDRRREA